MADKYHLTYSSSCTPVAIDDYTVAGAHKADGSTDDAFNTTHTRRLVKSSNGAIASGGAGSTDDTNETASKVWGSGAIASGKHFCTDNTAYQIGTVTASIGSDSAQSNAGNTIPTSSTAKFVAFKIRAINDGTQDSTTVDCQISLDGSNYDLILTGVGDGCVLPLNTTDIADLKVKSSAVNKCCFVTICGVTS